MEVFIIVAIITIIAILFVRSVSKQVAIESENKNQLSEEEKQDERERLRIKMIGIGVGALTSTEMNDSEKDSLLTDAKEFFVEHFPDTCLTCFQEMATQAYKIEIENFKDDKDLRLRISERYQKYLKTPVKEKEKDFGFTDILFFSSFYRDNYNPESNAFKMNEIRKDMIRIVIESLVSTILTPVERATMLDNLLNDLQESFPNAITESLEEMASKSYQFELDNFTNDSNLNNSIKDRYQKYQKTKKPIAFSEYGFEDIQDFAEQQKIILKK